ncbi:MAG TPA: hypothetical protein VFK40_07940, partial [Nitrososphaeraceae archaeon]|nr:hypothetical protein [Nitrososphaeraceae archaeon]
DEWNNNRKKLKCCRDIIKAVNIRLIDWFNEIYQDRYSSLRSPARGYYIFNTNIICVSCNNKYKNKKVWLCVYHWKQHRIDNH